MPNKVLYVCGGRSFHSDRPGRKIGGVVQSWRSLGHDVLHLCGGDLTAPEPERSPRAASSPAASATRGRPWYRRIGLLAPLERSVSERRDIVHDKLMLARVLSEAARFGPDLIVERSTRLHFAGLLAARQLGLPYVLEWKDHLVPYRVSRYHRRAVAVEQRKNREADFVIVESECLRQQLATEGVDPAKTLVAQNAVDPGQFTRDAAARPAARAALGVGDDEVLAGYLGSYTFYHDARRLVLAANLLRKRGHRKIRILMIGDGLEYQQCRRLAERLGLLDSASLMIRPRVAPHEVPGILSALDIAVLPGSTDIICPIKVQEYMAAELPTVLPDYPANREVITHGETGWLFAPKDEVSLAAALESLAGDPSRCRQMGVNARRVVLQRFTWEKTWGAALEQIIERIGLARRS